MTPSDRITRPAQILRQVLLHLGCGLVGHRIQVRIQFRQEAEAIAFSRPVPRKTK